MPTHFVPKEFSLHTLKAGDKKKVLEVLSKKGIPSNYNNHVYRSDSDSYSFGMSVALEACKKGRHIFELRSDDDDVYFWLVKDTTELVKKFTNPGKDVTFQDWMDEDGLSEDEEEEEEENDD